MVESSASWDPSVRQHHGDPLDAYANRLHQWYYQGRRRRPRQSRVVVDRWMDHDLEMEVEDLQKSLSEALGMVQESVQVLV